jgi:hypothetical protein
MGTTIAYGLLAWVVGVICPRSGLDNPAVASSSAAGKPEDLPTIATAHKQCQTPAGISLRNNPVNDSNSIVSTRAAGSKVVSHINM